MIEEPADIERQLEWLVLGHLDPAAAESLMLQCESSAEMGARLEKVRREIERYRRAVRAASEGAENENNLGEVGVILAGACVTNGDEWLAERASRSAELLKLYRDTQCAIDGASSFPLPEAYKKGEVVNINTAREASNTVNPELKSCENSQLSSDDGLTDSQLAL